MGDRPTFTAVGAATDGSRQFSYGDRYSMSTPSSPVSCSSLWCWPHGWCCPRSWRRARATVGDPLEPRARYSVGCSYSKPTAEQEARRWKWSMKADCPTVHNA
jgi:hypothetical protein